MKWKNIVLQPLKFCLHTSIFDYERFLSLMMAAAHIYSKLCLMPVWKIIHVLAKKINDSSNSLNFYGTDRF